MWILGDWGQAGPWTRTSGVKMTKGEDGLYTGVLTLPKGTRFDLKILKSTVEGTSGGSNVWSAVRYASVLNSDSAHDFGEFTDNLVPNGSFDEGKVKWTPASGIGGDAAATANSAPNVMHVGGANPTSTASDVFTLPPNQSMRLSGYFMTRHPVVEGVVTMKIVTPQHHTLFEFGNKTATSSTWVSFSKTFQTADTPTECQIVLSNPRTDDWTYRVDFDTLSLVSP